MGSTWIQGFLDAGVDIDEALKIHLTGNHFPPVHIDFIPAAKKAIQYVIEDKSDKIIKMPNDKKLSAYDIVEGLHLWTFIDNIEEDNDNGNRTM